MRPWSNSVPIVRIWELPAGRYHPYVLRLGNQKGGR